MGTWDVGPFDNDFAADWSGELQDAERVDHLNLIRTKLSMVATGRGYLEYPDAAEAVAAAAILAAQLPGAKRIASPHAPDFVREGDRIPIEQALRHLAVEALDRVLGDDSEWRELWEDVAVEDVRAAFVSVHSLRCALEGSGSP